jgi:hypothetical protein
VLPINLIHEAARGQQRLPDRLGHILQNCRRVQPVPPETAARFFPDHLEADQANVGSVREILKKIPKKLKKTLTFPDREGTFETV